MRRAPMAAIAVEKKSGWSLLPEDFVRLIASRLAAADFVRARAVCREWCHALTREPPPSPGPEFPWLLLPSGHVGDMPSSCSFLSFPDRRRFHLAHLPEISGRRCVGSKAGLLVTLDLASLQPRILNPLTRSELPLPSLPPSLTGDDVSLRRRPDGSIYEFYDPILGEEYPITDFPDAYVKKIVLSTVPSGAVAVICGVPFSSILALAKPGDDRWSAGPKAPDRDYFDDAVYREEDGKFYAVTGRAAVLAFNVDGSAVLIIAPGPGTCQFDDITDASSGKYIVHFSSGVLLQIWRKLDFIDLPNGDDNRAMTVGFKVFRINPDGKGNDSFGTPMNDLGDRSVFLGGRSSSMAVVVGTVSGLRSGCIYFTEDHPETTHYSGKSPSAAPFMDVGWFDVREKNIGRYYPSLMSFTRSDWPAPIWFRPALI